MIARTSEPVPENAGGGESRSGETNDARTGGREARSTSPLNRRVRRVISFLLVAHLLAIASAPLAMEPSSLPARKVFGFFRPYLDAAFLNHGYHFFAPEPGPSHLIRYELSFSDGRTEVGLFPDPEKQRPRLNYHRHFMLSEFANQLAVNDSQQAALHELSRSLARHLMSERNAQSASLYLRRHYIPTPQQVRNGLELDAEELYAERPLGTFLASQDRLIEPPTGPNSEAGSMSSIDQSAGALLPLVSAKAAVRLTGQLRPSPLSADGQGGEVLR